LRLLPLLILLAVAACKFDGTISGYTDTNATWKLVELDGKPFKAHATIRFPSKDTLNGQAPCNTYGASQTVPLPLFKLERLISTKIACADMAAELWFFAALNAMTLAETLGDTMILSNETGREIVFKSTP